MFHSQTTYRALSSTLHHSRSDCLVKICSIPRQNSWMRRCYTAQPAFERNPSSSLYTAPAESDIEPSPTNQSPHKPPPRVDTLKSAKPFSYFLTDTFNRQHDYLRISITEKCNLRCLYCMPAEGVPLSPKKQLLTPQEILYLSSLFVSQGVTKIRLTGGEPTVHPQILPLLHDIGALRPKGLKELALTTNGLTLTRKLDSMVEAGVTGINLSLDTLDPFQFEIMTRRRGFDQVMKSIDRILEMRRLGASLKLKINAVVIRGLNDAQIMPFVEMTRDKDLEVRFIEYMPFDGNKWSSGKMLPYQEMLAIIKEHHPDLHKVQDHPNDTSKTFQVPGFQGRLGFITSMTEHFCGSCNRLRITSDGNLKVCLFGNSEVSLRDMLRNNFNEGEPIDEAAWESIKQLEMDHQQLKSNDTLRFDEKEMQLLDIIGMAVKRKKARHAGVGVLEHMKNRPMILIDRTTLVQQALEPNTASSLLLSHKIQRRQSSIPLQRIPFTTPAPQEGYRNSVRCIATSAPLSTRPKRGDPAVPSIEQAEPSISTLTHLTPTGEAHMVNLPPPGPPPLMSSVSGQNSSGEYKPATTRLATATSLVIFSNGEPYRLISQSLSQSSSDDAGGTRLAKGDVIAVSRIAGIMAAKRTADLIPLCHNIPLSGVNINIEMIAPAQSTPSNRAQSQEASRPSSTNQSLVHGAIQIAATVKTHGQTGVEMEALTAASVAALTVYDMCKAVDRGMSIENLKVTFKTGGRSGEWKDGIRVTNV